MAPRLEGLGSNHGNPILPCPDQYERHLIDTRSRHVSGHAVLLVGYNLKYRQVAY